MDRARILIADDEQAVRDSLGHFLARESSEVKLAEDGEQALVALRSRAWDALLLDLSLPKVNGLEVLEYIRKENLAVCVILSMSGEGDHEAAQESLRLGAHDFLAKPISLAYLAWNLRLRLPAPRA